MGRFEFFHNEVDGVAIGTPVGEIDAATAPALTRALTMELAKEPPAAVIIRLDMVTALDPVGIDALAGAQRRARERGIYFALAAPSRIARQTLTDSPILVLSRCTPRCAPR